MRRRSPSLRARRVARGVLSSRRPAYIVVTGGVLSGIGKGVTAASIGNILAARGFRVSAQKFDQYLNVDAGTLNPGEHGEVFVTRDGAETDLDLGHYERFLDEDMTAESSVMTGQIYRAVIEAERAGRYLGSTVQMIPHVTDAVRRAMIAAARRRRSDVHVIEIGGTVGDYEGAHFLEGARQLAAAVGRSRVLYVHVVFLPFLSTSDELKTKPAQNSVRDLRAIGIQPDLLIARSDHAVSPSHIRKLSLFTNVEPSAIIPVPTVGSMYEVPLHMEKYSLDRIIMEKLGLGDRRPRNDRTWHALVRRIKRRKPTIRIALVAKYLTMKDTYMSLVEALKAAAWDVGRDLDLWWVDAEAIESGELPLVELRAAAGIIVPGGFGARGTEGKIRAIAFARREKVPYLGLCLGMQLAVVEFARNVLRLRDAASAEFHPATPHPVIHIMEEQKTVRRKGGTMRLGAWPCILRPGTTARRAYGTRRISERHRHRYEFNNAYRQRMEKKGLTVAGTTPDGTLVEIVECGDHPFFVGVQFHPEFQSRPTRPHPLFRAFLRAAKRARGDGAPAGERIAQ